MEAKTSHFEGPAAWIEGRIREFAGSESNNLNNGTGEPAWADPVVGFSNGGDPLYEDLRRHVGPFHWTPLEIFTKSFPSLHVRPEELTVISWILPHTNATKHDNRKETRYPSERWARARIFGQQFNTELRAYLVAGLLEAGCPAMAPGDSPLWEVKLSERFGLASTWSERHVAYVSGLGTFGLCDGLITRAGKAMVCASVVAKVAVPPSERPYSNHHEYCLFYAEGTCRKCIERCPVGAITEGGHDKNKCMAYLHPTTQEYVKTHFGFEGYGCGMCQTGVPCESRIPIMRKKDGA